MRSLVVSKLTLVSGDRPYLLLTSFNGREHGLLSVVGRNSSVIDTALFNINVSHENLFVHCPFLMILESLHELLFVFKIFAISRRHG
jgi:hypothetical protein